MERLGFIYDMSRCIGCKACQLACKEQNKLPVGVYFRRVMDCEPLSGLHFFYSGACNHCKNPACVAVCPVGAMFVDDQGVIRHEDALCMGCERCVFACPYSEVIVHPRTGLTAKCDACASLRAAGKPTACTGACPTGALKFGSLRAALEDAEENICYGGPLILPDPADTLPSLIVRHVPDVVNRRDSCGRSLEDNDNLKEKEYSVSGRKNRSLLENCLKEEEVSISGGETCAMDVYPRYHYERKARGKVPYTELLIIGGGIAAVSAARAAARNLTARLDVPSPGSFSESGFPGIKILGDEPYPAYCRPLLSKGLLKGFSLEHYQALPGKMMQEEGILYEGGRRAARIDAAEHAVYFEDGSREYYGKCIIATGADAFVPPIPGVKEARTMTIRKFRDLEALRRETLTARSVVVVGGGFIGLETAWQLHELGLKTAVFEGAPKILGRLVDMDTSERMKEKLKKRGLEVFTGVSIKGFRKEGEKSVVCLEGGIEYETDFIILSTGVRANVSLARDSGAEIGRNIKITPDYRTSLPDVYACGDCAEMEDGSLKQSWTDAVTSGRKAGRIAAESFLADYAKPLLAESKIDAADVSGRTKDADAPEPPAPADSMMVNTGDIHVLSAGMVMEADDIERIPMHWEDQRPYFLVNDAADKPYETPGNGGLLGSVPAGGGNEEAETFGTFFFKENRLIGACAIGGLRKVRFIQNAVTDQMTREEFLAAAAGEGMKK